MTASTGDSLVIRSMPPNVNARLLQVWCDIQTAGFFQITSPRLHDSTRGLRFRTVAGETKPLLAFPSFQKLYDADVLTLTIAENAVAGDIALASLLIYYPDIEGGGAKLIDKATLMKRWVQQVTVENTITTGAAGGYSGAEAWNAESALLKGNTEYALVGYKVAVNGCSVTWRGSATSNFRVSGPCDQLGADYTTSWFLWLAEYFDLPLIPVFNGTDQGAIFVEGVQDENATAIPVTSILVQLG
jgi:hypothetical protein